MRAGGWLRILAAVALLTATAGSSRQFVLAPSIRVQPSCTDDTPLRLVLTVTGRGFLPDDDVAVIFDPDRAEQVLGTAVTDNDGSFELTTRVTAKNEPDPEIPGYEIDVLARRGENRETTSLRVPCAEPSPTTTTRPSGPTTTTAPDPDPDPEDPPRSTPTLTMSPSIGPPGFVTTATGAGWPPGPVTIGWDSGGEPISALAGDNGSFRVPVLVLPGTTLGPQGIKGNGPDDLAASGTFLVVSHSAGPPIWNH